MTETIVLRTSLPVPTLLERFIDAIGRDADIDLVVAGRISALLPEAARRFSLGGRDALAAMALAPLFPKVFALLIQAHKFGRTWTCREVAGQREVIVEIRKDPRAAARER